MRVSAFLMQIIDMSFDNDMPGIPFLCKKDFYERIEKKTNCNVDAFETRNLTVIGNDNCMTRIFRRAASQERSFLSGHCSVCMQVCLSESDPQKK